MVKLTGTHLVLIVIVIILVILLLRKQRQHVVRVQDIQPQYVNQHNEDDAIPQGNILQNNVVFKTEQNNEPNDVFQGYEVPKIDNSYFTANSSDFNESSRLHLMAARELTGLRQRGVHDLDKLEHQFE